MIEKFHAPGTVREALRLKRQLKGRTAFLAGGTWLNSSECSLHPEHAISLAGLGLDRVVRSACEVSVGALCTLQRLAEDRGIPAPLKVAALQVRSRNIRNVATIGGHLAGNLPGSDLIPMLVALDAGVVLAGAGAAKKIPMEAWVKAAPAGLITQIVLPLPARNRVAACRNVRASANARSTLSVAVSLTVERPGIADPVIAIGGLGRHVIRLTALEKALDGKPLPSLDGLQALVGPLLPGAARRDYQAAALLALTLHDALRQKGGRS